MMVREFVPAGSGGSRPATSSPRPGVRAAFVGLLCLGLLAAPAAAQETGRVIGQVVEAGTGAPLASVQVYVEGTGLGTLTRQDGRFIILNVPAGTYQLRAERIGLQAASQQVTVAGDPVQVSFELETQALGLDEIVVTGTAGAARRREIGNSITQIAVPGLPEEPVSTMDLLQGSAAGIEVTGGDGQAGQGKQIRLRGNNSISMTNQPIIYVDGVRMMSGGFPSVVTPGTTQGRGGMTTASPLDLINPNDIERIEVIKGSAATTLYGTEASAGVIQIFTKKGSVGAPVWTAEIQQGTGWVQPFGRPGAEYLHMEHFLRDPWWGGGYEGGDLSQQCVTDDPRWQGVNDNREGGCSWPGAQWYQNYSLSVRGGGENLQYFLSGQYRDDQYALPLDEMQRYHLQGNFTMSPLEDLQIQWSTGYTNQWQRNTPSGNNLSGLELQTFRQERNYFSNGDPREIAKILEYDVQQWIERLTSGLTVTYSPLAGLTNRFTLGYDFSQQEGRNLRGFGYWEYPDGSLVNDMYQRRLLTFDYVSTLRFGLTGDISSSFSWGGQAVGDDVRHLTALGQNFPGAVEPTIRSASVYLADEERQKVWNAGFFFQNIFDLYNRYFITAGMRVDGNSAFGEGFGLQAYPKASASWVISDEAFWSPALGTLKLRAAYGRSGRAPGAFDAVRTWDPVGFAGDPAFWPENRGNPDLGPEVTSEFETGFDGSWLEDRLRVGFSYYHQTTRDALMDVSGIPTQGFSESQLENVGKVENKGIELQIDGVLYESADWAVDLGMGIATNHSKVLDLGGAAEFDALNGRIIEGEAAPVAWGQRVANPDEIGNFVYEDDGENVVIGPVMPTHFITPNVALRVPGSILLAARGEYRGGNVMEINPISISRSVRSPLCFPYYEDPANSIDLKEGTPAIWRERCTPSGGNDYWFDADYFKLRTVSATVPVDFAFPENFSNATMTLTLSNIWDWYREIPWYDAEVLSNDAANDDGIGDASERTPAPATLRLSLRVTF